MDVAQIPEEPLVFLRAMRFGILLVGGAVLLILDILVLVARWRMQVKLVEAMEMRL